MKKRLALSEDKVNFLSGKILENFLRFFQPVRDQKIHLFLPIKKFNEIDTYLFIKYFFENGIQVFVPKMIEEKLISVELTSETILVQNQWGISEPETDEDSGLNDFDYILTPLLYCDCQGNRIGYGKGFYDRFFSQLNNSECKKIGINFFSPDEKIDDYDKYDVPLDYLVTPEEILSFGKGVPNLSK